MASSLKYYDLKMPVIKKIIINLQWIIPLKTTGLSDKIIGSIDYMNPSGCRSYSY